MKKLLFLALLSSAALTLAGCGGNDTTTNSDTSTDTTTVDETVVLEDKEHDVAVVGQHEIKFGDEWVVNEWNIINDKETGKNNLMTAISIADAREIDATVGEALSKKNVKFLYKAEVRLGATDAGWTGRARFDDKNWVGNGSFAIKSLFGTYDAETDTYSNDQWVSHDHDAHVESLTPKTLFYPTWQEAKDENGFEWSSNPMCIGEAGVYTYILAQYEEVSSETVCGFGGALILKEAYEGENKQTYKEEVAFKDNTFGVIGSIEACEEWTKDIPMTYDEATNTFAATVTVKVNDEFKVRANGEWATVAGFADIKSSPDGAFVNSNGNIKVVVAGTYKIVIDEGIQLTITAALA